ncbi:hypothetical protein JX266_007587 [Neoarthrinium moseri]|nr:hypothetical protein JX266_007587 [Neoarthrinium moseri]
MPQATRAAQPPAILALYALSSTLRETERQDKDRTGQGRAGQGTGGLVGGLFWHWWSRRWSFLALVPVGRSVGRLQGWLCDVSSNQSPRVCVWADARQTTTPPHLALLLPPFLLHIITHFTGFCHLKLCHPIPNPNTYTMAREGTRSATGNSKPRVFQTVDTAPTIKRTTKPKTASTTDTAATKVKAAKPAGVTKKKAPAKKEGVGAKVKAAVSKVTGKAKGEETKAKKAAKPKTTAAK